MTTRTMPGRAAVRRPKCRHCRCRAANKSRGLCYTCYYDPAVRPLYGMLPLSNRSDAHERETAADLDALVARQAANLPAWWHREPKPRETAGPRLSPQEQRLAIARRHRLQ